MLVSVVVVVIIVVVVCYLSSVVYRLLLVVGCWLLSSSVIAQCPSMSSFISRWSSVAYCRSSVCRCLSLIVGGPSLIVDCRLSGVSHLSSVVVYRMSAFVVILQSSGFGRRLSIVGRQCSVVGRQLSVVVGPWLLLVDLSACWPLDHPSSGPAFSPSLVIGHQSSVISHWLLVACHTS